MYYRLDRFVDVCSTISFDSPCLTHWNFEANQAVFWSLSGAIKSCKISASKIQAFTESDVLGSKKTQQSQLLPFVFPSPLFLCFPCPICFFI